MPVWLTMALLVAACAPAEEQAKPAAEEAVQPVAAEAQEPTQVEQAVQDFLDFAHAYDYESLRAAATQDFEILIAGQRMALEEFEGFLREMNAQGIELTPYEVVEFKTEISGNVAYTSWRSSDWLESAVLRRSRDKWLIDRAFAMPVQHPSP